MFIFAGRLDLLGVGDVDRALDACRRCRSGRRCRSVESCIVLSRPQPGNGSPNGQVEFDEAASPSASRRRRVICTCWPTEKPASIHDEAVEPRRPIRAVASISNTISSAVLPPPWTTVSPPCGPGQKTMRSVGVVIVGSTSPRATRSVRPLLVDLHDLPRALTPASDELTDREAGGSPVTARAGQRAAGRAADDRDSRPYAVRPRLPPPTLDALDHHELAFHEAVVRPEPPTSWRVTRPPKTEVSPVIVDDRASGRS